MDEWGVGGKSPVSDVRSLVCMSMLACVCVCVYVYVCVCVCLFVCACFLESCPVSSARQGEGRARHSPGL